jgi:23S rRNA (cytosine1962-C5)-methyltransferase
MMHPMEAYELLDAGDGRRLERFGDHIVDRPAPTAWLEPRAPSRWAEADLRFERDVGWTGPGLAAANADWAVEIADLRLELRPTDAGQVGLFPDHATVVPWLIDRVRKRDEPSILNLFAYTGLITLALARAGAAVAHIDALRSAVTWARRNAALTGLEDRPIRWLVDDARAFVAREVRRGRRYHGVVLDPPTYGHGTGGKAWRLDRDLEPLLADIRRLLMPDGFLLLTAHAESTLPDVLGGSLGPSAETGEVELTATSGARLSLGAFARVDGAA